MIRSGGRGQWFVLAMFTRAKMRQSEQYDNDKMSEKRWKKKWRRSKKGGKWAKRPVSPRFETYVVCFNYTNRK